MAKSHRARRLSASTLIWGVDGTLADALPSHMLAEPTVVAPRVSFEFFPDAPTTQLPGPYSPID